jgi:hypothetical protein
MPCFEGRGKLNPDDVLGYASSIGLQEDPFKTCITPLENLIMTLKKVYKMPEVLVLEIRPHL